MLDVENTGYEGKFDFSRREPETVYMLATVPRTGSSWLSHVLWQTGCLGAPLEYLNFDKGGPYFFAHKAPEEQLALWRSVQRRRTSPNGVFGFKCFLTELQALREENPQLLAAVRPRKVVYLARRDRIAHAVSYARARMSGIWRAEQERDGPPRLEYSQQALEMAEDALDAHAAGWEEMFRRLGVEPLRLWYEDALANPAEVADRIAAFVGVSIVPGAAVTVPAVRRQSGPQSREWAERYARSRGAGAGAAARP